MKTNTEQKLAALEQRVLVLEAKNPMPGSRGSKWKKKLTGKTVLRDEG